MISEQAHLS